MDTAGKEHQRHGTSHPYRSCPPIPRTDLPGHLGRSLVLTDANETDLPQEAVPRPAEIRHLDYLNSGRRPRSTSRPGYFGGQRTTSTLAVFN